MTLLLLIRHGLTDATGKRLSGWTPGIHLSARGREQAGHLVERLAGVGISAVYSSPIERCLETAAPLSADRRLRVARREDLGEVRYGSWTNRPIGQLMRTKTWRLVQQVPSAARFPDGESLLEVQERAIREVRRIASEHPKKTVAVFSHADVIKLVIAHFAGLHADLFQRLVVEPTSVSAIGLGDGMPRIFKVNDTGDLSSLAPARPRTTGRRTGG